MYQTLKYLFDDNEPLTHSPSLLQAFFYDDHFTRLYQEGLQKLRNKEDELEYHSLVKTLEELNTLQEPKIGNGKKTLKNKEFYQKNQEWLNERNKKLMENRELKALKEEDFLENERKRLKNSRININLPYNYTGPIEGWSHRVNQYFLSKNEPKPLDKDVTFKPNIDENSKKLMAFQSHRDGERVEDRLYRMGAEKLKKREII